MTIKTLTYIHTLLLQNELRTNETYQGARRLQHEYEDNNAPEELIKSQTEAADSFMKIHSNALDALLEFERKEWN